MTIRTGEDMYYDDFEIGDGFGDYVPIAQRRQQAARKLKELKKQGVKASPVVLQGRTIARTFWGKAWCENLESYSDFSNRLPRGRTYVRNGSVIHLELARGKVTALVSGSTIYEVEVSILPLPADRWRAMVRRCAGRIDSVVELLAGKLSNGVMEVLCQKGEGLFPGSREIALRCSCPDGAYLCKHVAAVLYAVGARLDQEPELLFVLRGVDQADLLSRAMEEGALARNGAHAPALKGDDLSGLFGIELDPGSASPAAPGAAEAPAPAPRRGAGRAKAKEKGTARSGARTARSDPARVTSGELLARGLRRSIIKRWLAEGVLLPTATRGAYLKTRQTEARIAQYLQTPR